MADFGENINRNSSILLSRNSPVALIVGVSGFIGSHLAEKLLDKNIQVIGIDDLSVGPRSNLEESSKDKKFHFLHRSIEEPLAMKLPRLDYAFFVADSDDQKMAGFKRKVLFGKGIKNFLEFIKEFSPKIVLTSSISLYDSKVSSGLEDLRTAEIHLARFAKENSLNARIVRLSSVYGPKMHFREDDPMIRLIEATLLDELQKEQTSLSFSTRALYIDDAVNLLVKAVLSGGTAQKIYDGALPFPIKVTEVKQILLDPVWYEKKGFQPSELPPWPTPNIKKTSKELSWRPKVELIEGLKKTIAYFKENNINISKKVEEKHLERSFWDEKDDKQTQNVEEVKEEKEDKKGRDGGGWRSKARKRLPAFIVLALIMYALVFPVISLSVGVFSIKQHLKNSSQDLQGGNFDGASKEIAAAKDSLSQLEGLIGSMAILRRVNLFNSQLDSLDQLVSVLDTGVDGVNHATIGTQALFKTTRVVSGEDSSDPKPLFQTASLELSTASEEISQVQAKFNDQNYLKSLPGPLRDKAVDFQSKLGFYANLVEKARVAANLLPNLTAIDSQKSYLVLLENNLELRGSGGFIGSYAKLDFANGRLTNIKVDDIYNLDGQLKQHVEPPAPIKDDLGQKDYYLRDSNFEPDFPTAARQAEFFYNLEAGERVNGVIAMDLSSSAKLLSAVGGIDLPDYQEHVDGTNLFEKAISHAEVGFFPGSQAKKNYLTSLQNQLFNKIFFLNKQNWPAIIEALSQSLAEKHMLVYLDDPTLFSSLNGENWSGALPRPAEAQVGDNNDFLASIDTNLGADKANYYLTRSYNLQTLLGKEGQVFHHLQISYTNNSPSNVFPAGPYKNRYRIYLPVGAKLDKAVWGTDDITKTVTTYSDYGRAVYSMLIVLNPKESKVLTLDYELANPLTFKPRGEAGDATYKLDIFKQAGTDKDSFNWTFTYPINFTLTSLGNNSTTSGKQEVDISTDLQTDRSFMVGLTK